LISASFNASSQLFCDFIDVDVEPRISSFARLGETEEEEGERERVRAGIGREGNDVGKRLGEVRIVVRTSICRFVSTSFGRRGGVIEVGEEFEEEE